MEAKSHPRVPSESRESKGRRRRERQRRFKGCHPHRRTDQKRTEAGWRCHDYGGPSSGQNRATLPQVQDWAPGRITDVAAAWPFGPPSKRGGKEPTRTQSRIRRELTAAP
eukprot:4012660-Pyramimonas_sp.AAC.1